MWSARSTARSSPPPANPFPALKPSVLSSRFPGPRKRDRVELLAPSRPSATVDQMAAGQKCRRRRCRGTRNWGWRRLANHRPRTGNLLFYLQNLLGKRIDLGVDLIDLFFKRGNLAGRWGILWRLSECAGDHELQNRAGSEKFHFRNSDIWCRGWQARARFGNRRPNRKSPERLRF